MVVVTQSRDTNVCHLFREESHSLFSFWFLYLHLFHRSLARGWASWIHERGHLGKRWRYFRKQYPVFIEVCKEIATCGVEANDGHTISCYMWVALVYTPLDCLWEPQIGSQAAGFHWYFFLRPQPGPATRCTQRFDFQTIKGGSFTGKLSQIQSVCSTVISVLIGEETFLFASFYFFRLTTQLPTEPLQNRTLPETIILGDSLTMHLCRKDLDVQGNIIRT